jgi:hypothetical protein
MNDLADEAENMFDDLWKEGRRQKAEGRSEADF